MTSWIVSGSSCWPIAVEPTTSTNSTDTCFSCCAPAPSRAARQWRAQRRQRGVDDRVAEQRTLRLERGDGRGQLLGARRLHGVLDGRAAAQRRKPRAGASHSSRARRSAHGIAADRDAVLVRAATHRPRRRRSDTRSSRARRRSRPAGVAPAAMRRRATLRAPCHAPAHRRRCRSARNARSCASSSVSASIDQRRTAGARRTPHRRCGAAADPPQPRRQLRHDRRAAVRNAGRLCRRGRGALSRRRTRRCR